MLPKAPQIAATAIRRARRLTRLGGHPRRSLSTVGTAAAVGGLLILALWSAFASVATPVPAPVGASAERFSAERALEHIRAIADEPRPTGSPGAAATRAYLDQALTGLGIAPTVSVADVCRPGPVEPACGRVQNVSATIPGRAARGTVVVVAHYDSVPGGPGASDNGLGVATALEVARAVSAGPGLANNVRLLFTDGEEAGLLGAAAALDAGLLPGPETTAVVNLESRGQTGPVVMFETGDDNAAVTRALGGNSAVATSMAEILYRLLPNETDFSVFREAGYSGLNIAPVVGSARYDTAQDDVGHVDRKTLQDMGDSVLPAVRHLADADLPAVLGTGRVAYFPVFDRLVVLPAAATVALGLATLALGVLAVVLAVRRGRLRVARVVSAAAVLVAVPVVAAVVGGAGWRLALSVRPDLVGFVLGDPYRPGPAYGGFAVVAAVLGVAAVALARRAANVSEVVTAWVALSTVAGGAFLIAAPGAAYLFLLPACAGAISLALRTRVRANSGWPVVVSAGVAAVALAVWLPPALLMFPAVGLSFVGVSLVVVGWLTVAVVAPFGIRVAASRCPAPPNTAERRRVRPRVVAWSLTALAVLGFAAGVGGAVVDPVDNRHPRQISLIYAWDADAGTATWLSPYPASNAFIDRYVTDAAEPRSESLPLLYAPSYRSGPAGVVPVAEPWAALVEDRSSRGVRTITFRVGSTDTPYRLGVYVDAEVRSARVAGQPLAGGVNRPNRTEWPWGFTVVGAPAEGTEVELEVPAGSAVRVRLLAQTAGLPAGALDEPMPRDVTGAIGPAVQTLSAVTRQW